MNSLRTPDERFVSLPDWPYEPRYCEPLGDGLRMAYVDTGPSDAPITALCLHGNPSWSFIYRHMVPVFAAAGLRVVAPDLFGFGRSDKPVEEAWHSFEIHRQSLLNFVEALDLHQVLLVCQDWGGILGLTLPMAAPSRYTRLLAMNTMLATGGVSPGFVQWRTFCAGQPDLAVGKLLRRGKPDMTAAEAAGYDAPYPDASTKAALRAFPPMVPDGADAPGAALSREAAAFWQNQWSGDSFMAVGAQDPVLGPATMATLRAGIRGCPEPMVVAEGGHFVQEWGGPIARAALHHFGLRPD